MSHKYPVKVSSIKHDIRDWTVTILQETLHIINQIKHNIEMIIHYLTLCKKDTSNGVVESKRLLERMKLNSKDLLETSTIWE